MRKLSTVLVLILSLFVKTAISQNFCANEVNYWTENFGSGTNPSCNPDVLPVLTCQPDVYDPNDDQTWLTTDGNYRVTNNVHQKPEWHTSPDHTGNLNGKMLVINGLAETFYQHTIDRANPSGQVPPNFAAGHYSSSLYLMNIDPPGVCAPNPLLPTITFKVEYKAADNSWVQLGGSPVTVASVPQSATPTWVKLGGVFTLPVTGTFIVTKIRITLNDGTTGGCGNDFAIDDIKFASCPSGSPLPVSFLNFSAAQKGSGVRVDWATSTEVNNRYFNVERSIDGGASWTAFATVQGKGNGASVQNYTAYDPSPIPGYNYYRLQQVDRDNVYHYSSIAKVKINVDKIGISVIENPFVNKVTVDFLSPLSQSVTARLYDLSGRRIAQVKWDLSKGTTRKEMNTGNAISKGMYILSITDENGVSLFHDKLIKQ